jgi:hypothetical protein
MVKKLPLLDLVVKYAFFLAWLSQWWHLQFPSQYLPIRVQVNIPVNIKAGLAFSLA